MSLENENSRPLRKPSIEFQKNRRFEGLPIVSVHLDVDMMLMSERPIKTARDAIDFVSGRIYNRAEEEAMAIFHDVDLSPICIASVGKDNTTDGVYFSPRDIVQTAMLCNASYVTILHNHPGFAAGKAKCSPSKDDIAVTDAIIDACNMVGVKLYDSIIVSAYKETPSSKGIPVYYSIREHNFRRLLKKSGLTYVKERPTEENDLSFERNTMDNTRGGRVSDITKQAEGIRYYAAEAKE